MTPAGGMQIVNSSFHTVNLDLIRSVPVLHRMGKAYCWTYFGRHDMMYWPYLCSDSLFASYASAGLTIGALSLPCESRGAYCLTHQYEHQRQKHQGQQTLMFGVLASSAATSFARSAVVAKVRAATTPAQLAERTAALNGRATASRRAITFVESVVRLLDAV